MTIGRCLRSRLSWLRRRWQLIGQIAKLQYDAACIAAHAGQNLTRARRLEKRNQVMKPFDAAFYQFLERLAEEEVVPLDIPADLGPS